MYWELSKSAEERVEAIAAAVRGKRLILATDPDREGEAISWHLLQELKVQCSVVWQGRAVGVRWMSGLVDGAGRKRSVPVQWLHGHGLALPHPFLSYARAGRGGGR